MPSVVTTSKSRPKLSFAHFLTKLGPSSISRKSRFYVEHEDEDELPPPPPPKELFVTRPRRRHVESWQQTFTAYDISPFARSPSPVSSSGTLEVISEYSARSPLFLTRQLRTSEANLAENVPATLQAPSPAGVRVQPIRSSTAPSRIPMATSRPTPARGRIPPRRTVSTPDDAEIRRREMIRRKEMEEQQARKDEEERQARLKREKEEILKRHMEEEKQRKAALEEELRRVAEERRKKEAIEQAAEERRRIIAEEKRRKDRERRLQETQKLQAWRREQTQRAQELSGKREESRRRIQAERQALAKKLKRNSKTAGGRNVFLSGWVTVQADQSPAWKRRYYELDEKSLLLFRNPEVRLCRSRFTR